MAGSIGGTGADFWGPRYGLSDFPSFEAAAQRVIPEFLPFGNLGMDSTAIGLAWNLPWSNPGVLLQSLLKADGYTGEDRTTAGQMAQIPAGAVANESENQTMGQLIIPGCFQVAIHGQCGGQAVDNVIGLQNNGGSAAAAAASVKTAWEQAGGPITQLPSGYRVLDYTAVDIGSSNGDIVVLASTAVGSVSTAISTNGACALVQWNGGTRSRSSRGRLYHGPLTEGMINSDGRTINSTQINAFNGNYDAFRTSLAGAGYPLVVLSRKLNAAFPVTAHTVETVIATQRRRIR